MPLHPDAEAVIRLYAGQPQPPQITVAEFRAALNSRPALPADPWEGEVQNLQIAGGDGQIMAVRIYRPQGAAGLPVLVWLHGGSFVRGALDTFEQHRRNLAREGRCILVAVEQRLAPEAQFPKAIEDGRAALVWAHAQARQMGGEPSQIGIGGESSGANQAAAVSVLAGTQGAPKPAFQLLAQPLLDARLQSHSLQAFGNDYLLSEAQLRWAFDLYAPGISRSHPLLSPLLADDLSGMPPTAILTAEYDPLRDDGELFAARLRSAGVPVLLQRMDGFIHTCTGDDRQIHMGRLLRRLLTRPPRGAADG
jgi:acetyl esterase